MTPVVDINRTARRVSVQQQIAATANFAHRTEDHLNEVVSQVMVIASNPEDPAARRAALVAIAGECQAWIEQLDERAAR